MIIRISNLGNNLEPRLGNKLSDRDNLIHPEAHREPEDSECEGNTQEDSSPKPFLLFFLHPLLFSYPLLNLATFGEIWNLNSITYLGYP